MPGLDVERREAEVPPDISIIGPVSCGTTDASTTPSMVEAAIFARSSRSLTIKPSSSAVRSRDVARRQLRPSAVPSNTPRTMLVFPMSMASSMMASYSQMTSPATTRSMRPPHSTSKAPSSSRPAVVPATAPPAARHSTRAPTALGDRRRHRSSTPPMLAAPQRLAARRQALERPRQQQAAVDRAAQFRLDRGGPLRHVRQDRSPAGCSRRTRG